MPHAASFPQACNRIPGDEHRGGVHAKQGRDTLCLYVFSYALFGFSWTMLDSLNRCGTSEIMRCVKLDTWQINAPDKRNCDVICISRAIRIRSRSGKRGTDTHRRGLYAVFIGRLPVFNSFTGVKMCGFTGLVITMTMRCIGPEMAIFIDNTAFYTALTCSCWNMHIRIGSVH